MTRNFTHFVSIFFLSLLLLKGVISVVPSFSSSLKDLFAKELLAESESEQKKGPAKIFEANPTEELFDHIGFPVIAAPIIAVSGNLTADISDDLSNICLDIPTPPPNRL